jgi:Xaa-Pro aminopeptidase
MTTLEADKREATGAKFSLSSMQYARTQSWEAVRRISDGVRPGMTEQEAQTQAGTVLKEMGMDRIWHPIIVRFGEATLKTFKERSDPERVLGVQDIFFVDIGPVW